MAQDIGDINIFIKHFKQRLADCFTQNWEENINNSSRCDFYKHIKSQLNPEKYLTLDLSFYLRKSLARFRCSSHKLKIEIGRHLNIERPNRICSYCLHNFDSSCVEDEFHVFFQCQRFKTERDKYLYTWYTERTRLEDFYALMKSNNDTVIRHLSLYISHILKLTDKDEGVTF